MKMPHIRLLVLGTVLTVGGCAGENELRARRYMALVHACEKDDLPKALRLLQEDVEPNGDDFIHEFPKSDVEYFGALTNAPIMYAAENGNFELVRILLQYGADPNWCCCSCVTPLHVAILNEHTRVVALLLAHGADATINYDGQMSTLALAEEVGNESIIQMILAASNMVEADLFF